MWDRNISDAKNLKEHFSVVPSVLPKKQKNVVNKWLSARMQPKNEQFSSQDLATINEVILNGEKFVGNRKNYKRVHCKCMGDINFDMSKYCILCPYNERLPYMKVLSKEKCEKFNEIHKFKMPIIKKLIDVVEQDSIHGIAMDFDSWMEDITNYELNEKDDRVNLEAGQVFIKPLQIRKIIVEYEKFDYKNFNEIAKGECVSFNTYRKIIRTLFKWEGFIGSVPFPLKLYAYLQGKYIKEEILLTKYLFQWSKYEPGGSTSYNLPHYHKSPE